jgi:hypothetical protein
MARLCLHVADLEVADPNSSTSCDLRDICRSKWNTHSRSIARENSLMIADSVNEDDNQNVTFSWQELSSKYDPPSLPSICESDRYTLLIDIHLGVFTKPCGNPTYTMTMSAWHAAWLLRAKPVSSSGGITSASIALVTLQIYLMYTSFASCRLYERFVVFKIDSLHDFEQITHLVLTEGFEEVRRQESQHQRAWVHQVFSRPNGWARLAYSVSDAYTTELPAKQLASSLSEFSKE